MTDTSEREYKKAMRNPIEAGRDYLLHLGKHTVGIAGWEFMHKALEDDPTSPDKLKIPGSALLAGFEFVFPVTTRWLKSFGDIMEDRAKEDSLNNIIMETDLGFLAVPVEMGVSFLADIALWQTVSSLSYNPQDFLAYRLAANAAAHISVDLTGAAANGVVKGVRELGPKALDLAGALANKIRNHWPAGTNLAV